MALAHGRMDTPSSHRMLGHLGPIGGRERIALLDVVRGFTLYGVLLANTVPWFSGHGLLPKAEAAARIGTGDEIAFFFLTVFVSRKSQTLLTCLFGLGFAIQLARAEGRAGRLYLRRLAILLVIGVCHAAFVWWGDVLAGYALCGGALILFHRRSDRALLAWATVLVFVPKFVTSVPAVSAFLDRVTAAAFDRAAFDAELLLACRGDDYALLVKTQAARALYYFLSHAPEYIPWMIGHFLVGFLVGRRRALETTTSHLARWRQVLAWSAGLGLAGGTLSAVKGIYLRRGGALSTAWKMALIVPEEVGILAMALAYVSGLVLLMHNSSWRPRVIRLAPAGQMALTTYLLQSVIMTFVFYGWGLGLLLRVGPAWCIPLTLAVFGAQIAFAAAWLRRFYFGPVEWIWRYLTYGKAPRMRRSAPDVAAAPQR
jgi:uncharacterized protein